MFRARWGHCQGAWPLGSPHDAAALSLGVLSGHLPG